jgi:chromosome segregation ATPase
VRRTAFPWPWLGALVLAACVPAGEACDPARVTNLATAAACDAGGQYDQRRAALQTQLGDQAAVLYHAQEEARLVAGRAAELARERRLQADQLAAIDREIARAKGELAAGRTAAVRDRARTESLETRLRQLEAQRSRALADRAAVEAEIEVLTREVEQRRQALQDALKALVPEEGTAAAAR